MKRALSLLTAILILGSNAPALAHGLFCHCKTVADGQVRCDGGMSDGTALPGATLDVMGYDEKTLISGKLGDDSSYTFSKPDGPFYVLLELGPGHTVEVDHTHISEP